MEYFHLMFQIRDKGVIGFQKIKTIFGACTEYLNFYEI